MVQSGYLLGYDVGSSSIKASLLDAETQAIVASATSPQSELEISSPQSGFAEQAPELWWTHIKAATAMLKQVPSVNLRDVRAIGISYQMHGLVAVDKDLKPLMPSIIWCDSRAVEIGNKALREIGEQKCLRHLLNSPGNFTASKLAWVKQNAPDIYNKIYKVMLPGDYIAMKLTGEIATTASGLSEGMLWDFAENKRADFLIDYYGFNHDLYPAIVPTFSVQAKVKQAVAEELGLTPGTPVCYRAGDQPNNAFSLNVLNPGEIAATAGTSGVVYGVGEKVTSDPAFRVNTFAHVNHTGQKPRYGVLLCVNGTGILNRWMKQNVCTAGKESLGYEAMNREAQTVAPGCSGLKVLPYGNGAERTLGNLNIHGSIHGLDFSIHSHAHLLRAAQEGIVFALQYGIDVMKSMGVNINKVRAGDANMFKSPLFAEVFSTLSGASIELCNTDGAQGAARAAGIGSGIYRSPADAFKNLATVKVIEPTKKLVDVYKNVYGDWKEIVGRATNQG